MEQPAEEGTLDWVNGIPVPQAVVDGGSEDWAILGAIVQRRVDALRPDAVLEVVSHNRAVQTAIPTWCALHGHGLIAVTAAGDALCFCIQRGCDEG